MKKDILEKDISYYTNYWQKNVESIEEVSIELKKLLSELDKKHMLEDELENNVKSKINLLLSMYSSYNSIKGHEYLQKIRSVFSKYLELDKKQKTHLNTIDFLMNKVSELKDLSFSEFPELEHSEKPVELHCPKKLDVSNEDQYACKWICFSRNGSNFILKYDTILAATSKEIKISGGGTVKKVFHNNISFYLVDLFNDSLFNENDKPPLLLFVNESKFYAADSIEKKFLSNKDHLSRKIISYEFNNSIAEGYMKLGGKRYIVLK